MQRCASSMRCLILIKARKKNFIPHKDFPMKGSVMPVREADGRQSHFITNLKLSWEANSSGKPSNESQTMKVFFCPCI